MAASFLFYDLETSGFGARDARIMQFAAQRTDMHLKPIGEPFNYLIKLSDDILPDADAVLLTGITPQATIADGISEAEFLQIFSTEISTPDTIFMGFNSIRFDDEFMRFLHYRNFYDAYEWHWAEGRSRWDLLDVVRMTRALRPDGIKWPVDTEGKPANRLEMLSSINGLDHEHAHDALSDVLATIAVAKLIHDKQPELFTYLLKLRQKEEVKKFVEANRVFMYTSGKYASQYDKTTAVMSVCTHPKRAGTVVYDLRFDPTEFLELDAGKIAHMWQHRCKEYPCPHPQIPLKTLQFNRCPAVAPIGVLREADQERLQLPMSVITKHAAILKAHPEFCDRVLEATKLMDQQQQTKFLQDELDADARLYDNFISNQDKTAMAMVRAADKESLKTVEPDIFSDDRLQALLPLYKARNFPSSLNDDERAQWERFRERKLLGGKQESRAAKYFARLAQLAEQNLPDPKRYLLEELQLWGQSILPLSED